MHTNGNIPTIATNDFIRRIQKRKYEDTAELFAVEQLLVKKRGHVFRMPKPGSHVVLMASGGIDSTVAWHILATTLKLHVYPVAVISSRMHPQYAALHYFSRWYKIKLGDLYHAPFVVQQPSIPREIMRRSRGHGFSDQELLGSYDPKHKSFHWRPATGANMLNVITAGLYLKTLQSSLRFPIDTLFCAVTALDGIGVKSQSLTFIRTSNIYIMDFFADPKFQFASLFFEKETRWWAHKADIIRIGAEAGLPLERTYSCYQGGLVHCGRCGGCDARKWEFKESGVDDKTIYQINSTPLRLGIEVMRRLTGLFR